MVLASTDPENATPDDAADQHASVGSGADAPGPAEGLTLAPRYWVPLGVVVLALAIWALLTLAGGAAWPAAPVGLFGLFLAVQARQLRLQFCDDELLVRRNSTVIRRFPYAAWLGWRVFWPGLPVLLYFREERSIHLLPVLFDADALRERLENHLGDLGPSSPR
ncbi:MAG: DUF3119 family protein [Cyanobium sp.]